MPNFFIISHIFGTRTVTSEGNFFDLLRACCNKVEVRNAIDSGIVSVVGTGFGSDYLVADYADFDDFGPLQEVDAVLAQVRYALRGTGIGVEVIQYSGSEPVLAAQEAR